MRSKGDRGTLRGIAGRCSLFSLKRGKDACSGVETEHRQAEEMPSVRTITGSLFGQQPLDIRHDYDNILNPQGGEEVKA